MDLIVFQYTFTLYKSSSFVYIVKNLYRIKKSITLYKKDATP